MTKPILSDVVRILSSNDRLRALTLNFTFDGKAYNLDREETLKVVSNGVRLMLWSKYQARANQEDRERMSLMEQALEKEGYDLKTLKPREPGTSK